MGSNANDNRIFIKKKHRRKTYCNTNLIAGILPKSRKNIKEGDILQPLCDFCCVVFESIVSVNDSVFLNYSIGILRWQPSNFYRCIIFLLELYIPRGTWSLNMNTADC